MDTRLAVTRAMLTNTMRLGLLAVSICAASAPAAAEEITLTIRNRLAIERTDEPITSGVPLTQGFCRDATELTLLGLDDRPVPAQILVTNRYRDGSPRWVLLDFDADLASSGEAVYRLSHQSSFASSRRGPAFLSTPGPCRADAS